MGSVSSLSGVGRWIRGYWRRLVKSTDPPLAVLVPLDVIAQEAFESGSHFRGTSKPYTRWWWLAGPFRQEDIVYQLNWLKANGFGGVELAWLWLGHGPPSGLPGWLTGEWSDLLVFTKRYAEQLGLGCDFTFGSCWPFGGSCVRPEDAARTFTGWSDQRLQCSWEGNSKVPLLIVDHLRRDALEHYAAAMIPALSEALAGQKSALFCDSLELDVKGMWSPELWERFAVRFGYRLEPFSAILGGHPEVRYDYRKFLSEVMHQEFFEAFTDICHRAGALSRVQCHGAPTDLLAAYAAVDIPESEALLFNPSFSRIAASAAALAGKPVVSCETFTCIYGMPQRGNLDPILYWRKENLADLKLVADPLFAHGVNQIVWHGMPFNPPGGDHEFFASIHVGPDAHFAPDLPAFNGYLEQVSSLMKLGQSCADLAVYMPVEDNLVEDRIPVEKRTPGALYCWEMRHVQIPQEAEGFAPLWISAPFLKQAICRDFRLCVGRTSFSCLYVDCTWLDGDSLIEILRLAGEGLPVVLRRLPKQPGRAQRRDYATRLRELTKLRNVKSTLAKTRLRPLVEGKGLPPFWARQTPEHVYLFFAHPAAQNVQYPLRFGQALSMQQTVRHVRLNVGPMTRVQTLLFKPYQSLLFQVSKRTGLVKQVDITFNPPYPVLPIADNQP